MALHSCIACFDRPRLDTVVGLIRDHKECKFRFWGHLKSHLPEDISDEQAKVLLDNNILPTMISLQVDSKKLKDVESENKERTTRLIQVADKKRVGKDFKRALVKDDHWGKLLPYSWSK